MIEKKCSYCRRHPAIKESGFWPFCSKRCQELDLGAWAKGEYRIPVMDDDDEDSSESEIAAAGEQGSDED